jgi:Ca2+-dependent lipid-binding protein
MDISDGQTSNGKVVVGVEIDLKILAGRNLVAKDGSGFLGLGKAKTSDPYTKVIFNGATLEQTHVINKNLNPVWDSTFKLHLDGRKFRMTEDLRVLRDAKSRRW